MLLQERNYRLYRDDEMEEQDQIHRTMEDRDSAASLGLSGNAACLKIATPTNSFNNKLRRSTFDLSSFNSLATSSSDSSSYCVSTPTRIASTPTRSTLRYRGSSSSSGNPSMPEDVPRQSLARRGERIAENFVSREVREAPSEITRTTKESQGMVELRSHLTASGTMSTKDSQLDCLSSNMQFVLESIILGWLVVPFLELSIQIERYVRVKFKSMKRSIGYLFACLFASSSSFEDEPINFENQNFCSSLDAPVLEKYPQELSDGNEYLNGCSHSSESISCHSMSSSGEDDTADEHGQENGWGHFADFQDELADEASFVPSCSVGHLSTRAADVAALPPSCVTGLETLDEGREEDDDSGEDWTF